MSIDGRRIIVLTPGAYGRPGGIALYNRDVLAALATCAAVEQLVVLPRNVDAGRHMLPDKVVVNSSAASGKVAFVVQALRIARSEPRGDVVLCMHINLLSVAAHVARRHKATLVLWIYGVDAWASPARRSAKTIRRSVDHVVSISQTTLDRFNSWCSFPEADCTIMPNAIDLQAYGPGPARGRSA